MDEKKIALQIDLERKILRVVCAGFWTVADVHDYDLRQRAALREMALQGCPGRQTSVLIDTTQQGAQAPEVIAELSNLLSSGTQETKRVAVVVSSALLARQSGRSGPEHGVFYNEGEAMAWLLSD